MIFLDVNVLIYAHRQETPEHERYRSWLEQLINGDEPYAVANVVLSGFLRIVTHRRVFDPPSTMAEALSFVDVVRGQPGYVPLQPGARHWPIFAELCGESGIKGALVPDAYLAALAIEHGCAMATNDGDFKRFAPKLRVVQPWR